MEAVGHLHHLGSRPDVRGLCQIGRDLVRRRGCQVSAQAAEAELHLWQGPGVTRGEVMLDWRKQAALGRNVDPVLVPPAHRQPHAPHPMPPALS